MIRGGQYTFHIKSLHDRYGPIVRINPYELHISDPSYYETLYASSGSGEKRDKWEWYTKQFGTPEAMFATTSHDQHRARRAALNRFFSLASIRRLQPLLDEYVDRLLNRIHEAKTSRKFIPLEYAFAAFTNGKLEDDEHHAYGANPALKDVMMKYAYGECDHRLDREDWGHEYHDAVVEAGKAGSLMKQMIWIFYFIASLPVRLQAAISPGQALVLRLQKVLRFLAD